MFRIITGAIIILLGFSLLLSGGLVLGVSIIFPLLIIAVGGVIVLNNKEDEIEQIKSNKQTNHE